MAGTSPIMKFDRVLDAVTAAILGLGLLAAAPMVVPSFANAQGISVVVNGTAITSNEVRERQAFIRLTQKKNSSAKEVTEELVDELLVLQEAERRGISIPDSDIDSRFELVAKQVKLSTTQLGQALAQAGASARTFKRQIKYQLAYRRLVTGRITAASLDEKEIAQAIMEKKEKGERAYKYVLRQTIFVMPKGSNAGLRKREAEALKGKITSCDAVGQIAIGMRDVAVKDPVIRTSAQISKDYRARLDKLKPGQTLGPDLAENGLELVTLCERTETVDDTALRQEVQLKLADERMKTEAKRFTLDLRQRAVINYR